MDSSKKASTKSPSDMLIQKCVTEISLGKLCLA